LNQEDADLGSGGPVLLPDQPGPHPHLLLVGGKEGVLYALDRDDLGKYRPDEAQDPAGRARLKDGVYGAPAYWFGHVFVQAMHDRLRDFAFENGQLLPSRSTLEQFIPPATPAVSSNGSRNGIVWTIQTKEWNGQDRPAVLHAYDATNIAHELYSSEQSGGRDRAGLCLRFTIPTIANGRLYVGAKRELDVYGLR